MGFDEQICLMECRLLLKGPSCYPWMESLEDAALGLKGVVEVAFVRIVLFVLPARASGAREQNTASLQAKEQPLDAERKQKRQQPASHRPVIQPRTH